MTGKNLFFQLLHVILGQMLFMWVMARVFLSHIGTVILSTISGPVVLNKVLYVPELKQNLPSISQFTFEQDCAFHFNSLGFTVTDGRRGVLVATGSRYGNLYTLDSIKHAAFFSNRQKAVDFDTWNC